MTRRPLFHAFFHSIASLGYIPFALSSVFLSTSSPFVSNSIHPIATILIAFIPPLLLFPILCFSYRFLERFECISLTVQRARTYVMVAGSGLCLVVGMHLVMVYGVGNGSNTKYNRMVYSAPPMKVDVGSGGKLSSDASIKGMAQLIPSGGGLDSQVVQPLQVQPQEQGHGQEHKQNNGAVPTVNIAQVPLTATTLEDVDSGFTPSQEGGAEDILPIPSSILSSFLTSLIGSEQGSGSVASQSSSFMMDPLEAVLTGMERIAAATGVTDESAAAVEELMSATGDAVSAGDKGTQMETEIRAVEEIISATDATMGLRKRVIPVATAPGRGEVVVKSPVPMHLYPSAPASALEVSTDNIEEQPSQSQDKRDSVVGGQTALKIGEQEENASSQTDSQAQPSPALLPVIPQLDPLSIILMGAPTQQEQPQEQEQRLQEPILPWAKSPPYYPPAIASIIAASTNGDSPDNNANPSLYFDNQDPNRTFGYNLITVHWLLYLTFQAILICLLFTLFLGVLILTEFVLDREDEDLVQIQSLYWSRVVGIASATIISAVHGSLLSGYVLLEEHTDWIAKVCVGAIVVYWWGMVWIMNRITGPLPY